MNIIVVNFMPKPVSVGREGNDVPVGEVADDEALTGQGDVNRVGQTCWRIQRAKQVTKSRVYQNWTIYKRVKRNHWNKSIVVDEPDRDPKHTRAIKN